MSLIDLMTKLVEKHCAILPDMCNRDHGKMARSMLRALKKHYVIGRKE